MSLVFLREGVARADNGAAATAAAPVATFVPVRPATIERASAKRAGPALDELCSVDAVVSKKEALATKEAALDKEKASLASAARKLASVPDQQDPKLSDSDRERATDSLESAAKELSLTWAREMAVPSGAKGAALGKPLNARRDWLASQLAARQGAVEAQEKAIALERQTVRDAARADKEYQEKLSKANAAGACGAADCDNVLVKACARHRQGLPVGESGAVTSAATATGISWQASIAQGFADFLSSRAQAELALWIVEEMRRDMCKQTRDLFPESCALIKKAPATADDGTAKAGDDEDFTSDVGGALLASAIRADIEKLPARLAAHATWSTWGTMTGTEKANVENLFLVVQDIFLRLRHREAPLALLAGLESNETVKTLCPTKVPTPETEPAKKTRAFACGLWLLGKVAALSGDALTAKSFDDLVKPIAQILEDAIKVGCTAEPCSGNANLNAARIEVMVRAVHALEERLKTLGTLSPDATAASAGEVIQLTVAVVDAGLDLGKDEQPKAQWRGVRGAFLAIASISQGHYADGIRELISAVRVIAQAAGVSGEELRYISFAAEMANARTAAEVQTALEAAAAPIGTWRDKRRRFEVSVTGLLGIGGGYELPLDGGQGRSGSPVVTATGGAGIDLSWPLGKTYTAGLYFPLLDVGQLLSLPAATEGTDGKTDESSKSQPGSDFELAQIFAPGVYLRFGLGKTPLVFALGAQVAPQLRRYIRTDTAALEDTKGELFSVVRLQALLAVDLTLLPLHRGAQQP